MRPVVIRYVAALLLPLSLGLAIDPHPRVKKLIAAGRLALPYYLLHQDRLRALGVEGGPVGFGSMGFGLLQKGVSGITAPVAPEGDFNVLVILVDFSDKPSSVEPAFFDSLMYDVGGPSVRDYYEQTSYGRLRITTVSLPSDTGWVQMPQTYDYYVNGQNGLGPAYPRNAQGLVEDAVAAVDGVIDFAPFDNDSSGTVDALFIVHAGTGAEFNGTSDDIWSHAWSIQPVIYDGVEISRYAMVPELWVTPDGMTIDMTIGVYVHEMAHAVFGLPDLYDRQLDVNPTPSRGLSFWSLLASGSWLGPNATDPYIGSSPALPDAWSRIQMGYANEIVVSADMLNQPIAPATLSPDIYRLWTGGDSTGSEYFLVENRQLLGYDSYLLGSGLLIYHIDETMASSQNDIQWVPGLTDYGHYLVALEQADGQYHLERDIADSVSQFAGDPFPGSLDKTAFNDFSSPGSRSYAGVATNVAVENIVAGADTFWADLRISVSLPPVTISSASDIPDDQGRQVTLTWDAAALEADATYRIWLRDVPPTGPANFVGSTYLHDGLYTGVGQVPGDGSSSYSYTVATPADSSSLGPALSYFRVSVPRAAGGGAAFSPAASGYSVDNIPPDTVRNLTVKLSESSADLSWSQAGPDVGRYEVHTSGQADFIPGPATAPTWPSPADTVFSLPFPLSSDPLYVRVLAEDFGGNRGAPSDVLMISLLSAEPGPLGLPDRFALYPASPNPFNPATVIPFDVGRSGPLQLTVHDLLGREVARLATGTWQRGSHRVSWDGRDLKGRLAPSGIYFVRLLAGETAATIKLVLLR